MALLLNTGNTVSRSYTIIKPSPIHPIQPSECGDRTGNLFDAETAYGVLYNNGVISGELTALAAIKNSFPAELIGQQVTISVTANAIQSNRAYIRCSIDGSNIDSNAITQGNAGTLTVTITPTSTSDRWWFTYGSGTGTNTFSNLMLNAGSTPLPYQPPGYKIPILSNSTTTPVYFGEVETTRRIKKMVFTGQENWQRQTYEHTNIINLFLPVDNAMGNSPIYSNIVTYYSDAGLTNDSRANVGKVNSTGVNLLIDLSLSDFGSIDIFKTYLQQQYAAGTPVTVWYVLATPTTGIVNEPLRKIGDYADEVSGISIPTIAGANALSIGTTLQPSEVNVNYHGWHPVQSVHERESGQWD